MKSLLIETQIFLSILPSGSDRASQPTNRAIGVDFFSSVIPPIDWYKKAAAAALENWKLRAEEAPKGLSNCTRRRRQPLKKLLKKVTK